MVWLVVKFLNEDAVEAIPLQWYIEKSKQCYWPPERKRDKIRYMIRRQERPSDNWEVCKVQVLGEYESFAIAEKKANKAKVSDNLASQSDGMKGREYRIPKKKYVDESDSESGGNTESYSSESSEGNKNDRLSFLKFDNLTKKSEADLKKNSKAAVTTKLSHKEICQDSMSSVSHKEYSSGITNSSTLQRNVASLAELQRQILRELHIINLKVTDLSNYVYDVFPKQRTTTEYDIPNIINIFPVNVERLDKLEEWLATEKNQNRLAQKLGLIGGQKVTDITRRIMYKIFTNEVGSQYSWEGVKKKKVFKTLRIANVILRGVRRNKPTENSTDNEIILAIKSWLVRSKERLAHQTNKNADEREVEDHQKADDREIDDNENVF